MSQNHQPRKGSASSRLVQNYLTSKKGANALDCTIYDKALAMHNLESTLNRTTSQLSYLKKQAVSKKFKDKQDIQRKKENINPSNIRKIKK